MHPSDNTHSNELTRAQRREQAATDALRSLITDMLTDKFPVLGESKPELPITLSLKLRAGNLGDLVFEPDFREQLSNQLDAYLKPLESFQDGAVYDFHAQTHQLPTCRPPHALSVFVGYDPLGHPKWSLISETLPEELTLKIISGKELKAEQLKAYGKDDKAYTILAQVILGPLPVPESYREVMGDSEWALTCQVVETRNSQEHFALHLNLLAGGLLPDELTEMLQTPQLRGLGLALLDLKSKIVSLQHQALKAWKHQDRDTLSEILKFVPKELAIFSAYLQKNYEPQPKFPQVDMDQAKPEDWFWDLQRESWVVLGSNQQAHAFSKHGEFITSFPANPKRIQQRLNSERWRPAHPGEPGFSP